MRFKLKYYVLIALGLLLPVLAVGALGADYLYGPGGTTDKFVAAADATAAEKAHANFICTGTAGNPIDDLALNAALTAAGKGRKVQGSTGTFHINAPLAMTDSQTFQGAGMYLTTIKLGASATSSLTGTSLANGSNKTLKVTSTAGFRAGQAVTIFSSTALLYSKGESNFIASLTDTALVMVNNLAGSADYGQSWSAVDNAIVFTANSGIELAKPVGLTSAAAVTDCQISDLTLDGNKSNNRFGNYDEYQNGIHMARSHRTKIHNVRAQNWSMGGFLSSHYGSPDSGSDDCEWVNCVAYGNGGQDSAGTKKAGNFHIHSGKRGKFINLHSEEATPWGYYAYDWINSTAINLTSTNDEQIGFWLMAGEGNTFTNLVCQSTTGSRLTQSGLSLSQACKKNTFTNVQLLLCATNDRLGGSGLLGSLRVNAGNDDNSFTNVYATGAGPVFWDNGLNTRVTNATFTTTTHTQAIFLQDSGRTKLTDVTAYVPAGFYWSADTMLATGTGHKYSGCTFENGALRRALNMSATGSTITGCTFTSSGYGAGSNGAVRMLSDNTVFSNNYLHDGAGGSTLYSTGTGVVATGNIILTSSATPYTFTGAGSILRNSLVNQTETNVP